MTGFLRYFGDYRKWFPRIWLVAVWVVGCGGAVTVEALVAIYRGHLEHLGRRTTQVLG